VSFKTHKDAQSFKDISKHKFYANRKMKAIGNKLWQTQLVKENDSPLYMIWHFF